MPVSQILLTNTTLAWMAGIIDLKGRVTRKNNKQRAPDTKQIVLYVETREFAIVKRLSALTGIRPVNKEEVDVGAWSRRGCVDHCPEPHMHVHKNIMMPKVGRWTVTGSTAAIILYNIIPYLVADRNLVDVLHELLLQIPAEGQGRGAVDRAIVRMEQLGWDIPPYIRPKDDARYVPYDPYEGAVDLED